MMMYISRELIIYLLLVTLYIFFVLWLQELFQVNIQTTLERLTIDVLNFNSIPVVIYVAQGIENSKSFC